MTDCTVFAHGEFDGHETVANVFDSATGLRAIIAIHSTVRGPSLGGCRIWSYPQLADGLTDALRLSQGMTYKAALAGLPLGGGKAVIMLADGQPKTPEMMRAFGRAVDGLAGRYITAEDVGATVADMDAVAAETEHVAGVSAGIGDPSPFTAQGVYLSIRAALAHRGQALEGAHVAVKGLGSVGFKLCQFLHAAGAELTVADLRDAAAAKAAKTFGARIRPAETIHRCVADVYAPCALGGELNATSIGELRSGIVCGAANNQLATAQDGHRLHAAGVLFCPDYLVNAGGLIAVASKKLAYDTETVDRKVAAIPETLRAVLQTSGETDCPPSETADRLAIARLRPEDAAEAAA